MSLQDPALHRVPPDDGAEVVLQHVDPLVGEDRPKPGLGHVGKTHHPGDGEAIGHLPVGPPELPLRRSEHRSPGREGGGDVELGVRAQGEAHRPGQVVGAHPGMHPKSVGAVHMQPHRPHREDEVFQQGPPFPRIPYHGGTYAGDLPADQTRALEALRRHPAAGVRRGAPQGTGGKAVPEAASLHPTDDPGGDPPRQGVGAQEGHIPHPPGCDPLSGNGSLEGGALCLQRAGRHREQEEAEGRNEEAKAPVGGHGTVEG